MNIITQEAKKRQAVVEYAIKKNCSATIDVGQNIKRY